MHSCWQEQHPCSDALDGIDDSLHASLTVENSLLDDCPRLTQGIAQDVLQLLPAPVGYLHHPHHNPKSQTHNPILPPPHTDKTFLRQHQVACVIWLACRTVLMTVHWSALSVNCRAVNPLFREMWVCMMWSSLHDGQAGQAVCTGEQLVEPRVKKTDLSFEEVHNLLHVIQCQQLLAAMLQQRHGHLQPITSHCCVAYSPLHSIIGIALPLLGGTLHMLG